MMEFNHSQESNESVLTPQQSADVIQFYDNLFNGEARKNGWKDKVPLAKVALRTIRPKHTMRPDDLPMLTPKEMSDGLKYLQNPPKSEAYYAEADKRVDKRNYSYEDAFRELDDEGWE